MLDWIVAENSSSPFASCLDQKKRVSVQARAKVINGRWLGAQALDQQACIDCTVPAGGLPFKFASGNRG